MRFRALLCADQLDPFPIALELAIPGLVHVDVRRAAQAGKGHHYSTHLLIWPTFRPPEHVFYERMRIFLGAAVRLREL